jgi:hypothetical protein
MRSAEIQFDKSCACNSPMIRSTRKSKEFKQHPDKPRGREPDCAADRERQSPRPWRRITERWAVCCASYSIAGFLDVAGRQPGNRSVMFKCFHGSPLAK